MEKEPTTMPKRIFRHGPPSKLDTAPFGTECVCLIEKLLYMQYSHDEESPNWVLVGTIADAH